jgi:predicted secreted protein
MSITGSLVIFMILWWLILFLILPRNISSQEETGNVIKGTDPGAPANSNIKKS